MVKVLELFSGTKSIGKVCDQLGWDTVSVDMILPADHKVDIMDFDYKQYPKNHFDIVWGSPPCSNYSCLQNSWLGRIRIINKQRVIFTREIMEENMKKSDELALKCIEIIEYFNPEKYFMENPAGSRLKDRDFMKKFKSYVADYCMYSNWGYKKSTRFWTNVDYFKPLRCNKKCGNFIDGKHLVNLGGSKQSGPKKSHTLIEKYRIPPKLIYSLFGETICKKCKDE